MEDFPHSTGSRQMQELAFPPSAPLWSQENEFPSKTNFKIQELNASSTINFFCLGNQTQTTQEKTIIKTNQPISSTTPSSVVYWYKEAYTCIASSCRDWG